MPKEMLYFIINFSNARPAVTPGTGRLHLSLSEQNQNMHRQSQKYTLAVELLESLKLPKSE